MRSRGLLALLLAATIPAATPRRVFAGGESIRPAGEPPRENASYVPDDDEGIRRTRKAVDEAVAAKAWPDAVRGLQKIAEGAREAVVLSSEGRVYEGVGVAAHHEVLRLGAPALAAFRQEFGPRAREALAAAAAESDEDRLADVVERWLPAEEAVSAAFLLADLASVRGDRDAALGWLERVEDLEDVAAEDLAADVLGWREARLSREALAFASDRDALARVRAWRAAPDGPRPADADLRRPRPPLDWPTSGGGPSRAVVPAAVDGTPTFRWLERLHVGRTQPGSRRESSLSARQGRPSPWLPPRAVVLGSTAYASDGRFLHAIDLATGTRTKMPVALTPDAVADDVVADRGIDARRRLGLLEGHALTASEDFVWCAVPPDGGGSADLSEGRPGGPDDDGSDSTAPAPRGVRGSRIVAVRFGEGSGDAGAGRVVWSTGGEAEAPGLPARLNLFGAPLLYHGALYVAGVRVATSSKDRAEAFLVALDPATGRPRWVTALGAGDPIRSQRHDELIPSSCAAARGRVTVVTNLGIAASVDARSGRTLWSYRYDRARPDGSDTRQRLDSEDFEAGDRRTSFANEPPLLAGGRCFLAPTDARQIVAISDRPRGKTRLLSLWRIGRTEAFRNLAVEQLVGATEGLEGTPPLLVVAGQGEPTQGEIQTCVAALDARTGGIVWDRALPSGGFQEPFGRAAISAREVFVPTIDGIAGYRLADGTESPFLGREAIPSDRRSLLGADERPWGNLVVVGGKGILAVNENEIAWWGVR